LVDPNMNALGWQPKERVFRVSPCSTVRVLALSARPTAQGEIETGRGLSDLGGRRTIGIEVRLALGIRVAFRQHFSADEASTLATATGMP
jgi:hypothetical protein